jgi:MSHA biogenesis protein MshJ
MSSNYAFYKNKVASMTVRERVMVCLVGVVLFVFPGFFGFIESNTKSISDLKTVIANQKTELQSVSSELEIWQGKLTGDPNEIMRKDISDMEKELKLLDQVLSKETVNLIDAGQMPEILTNVLSVGGTISIQGVESLKPKTLLKKGNVALYQHGIRVTLRGKYLDILSHLKNLEGMEHNFYWSSMDYKVDEYPYAVVILELYTLSINKDFIRG